MEELAKGIVARGSRRHLRLFRRSPMILLPVDGSLIDGPQGHLARPADLFTPELCAELDGVVAFPGLFQAHARLLLDVPQILNLTASTVHSAHTSKKLVGTIEHALALDVDAVAVHVNVTDRHEGKMIRNLAQVVEAAYRYRMPVLAIAYPRQSSPSGENEYEDLRRNDHARYTDLVAHSVRIMADLGVDLIKTRYTGHRESFQRVVEGAMGVPVVAAGGSPVSEDDALANAIGAVSAGAIGVAYGRQIFLSSDPGRFVQRLRRELMSVVSAESGGSSGAVSACTCCETVPTTECHRHRSAMT